MNIKRRVGPTFCIPRRRVAAVSVLLLSASQGAWALWDDRLEVFASEAVATDSNVFRISGDRDPTTFIGSAHKDDTYTTTSVGFNLDIPVSLQRFQAGASWNQIRYNRFSDLNRVDRDARLNWLWQIGSDLSGQLGYTESHTLASFTIVQGRTAVPLTNRRTFGNASYLLNSSWQVQAGVAEQRQRYENALRQDNDIDLRNADFRVNYISTAGNKLGVVLKQEEGRYPHRQLVAGNSIDNAYSQRSLGLATEWALTAKSHLNANLDRAKRSYDQLGQRDYSGTLYRVAYDWAATEKLSLNAVAQRDIATTEDIQTSFVLIKGVALTPTFVVSEKVRLSATLDASVRDYLGDPGLALGTLSGRSDRVNTVSTMLTYQPMRALSLVLSGQRETRSSNVPLNDYRTSILSVKARIAF